MTAPLTCLRAWRLATASVALAALAGCSSLPFIGGSDDKPKPTELQANPNLLGVRQVWSARVGEVGFPLGVAVNGNQVTVASSDGNVVALDATSGREVWRAAAGGALAAGVGSDGTTAAVVTRGQELVAMTSGRVLWRQKLPVLSYTPPLVAGARVFVLGADRSVSAFDGQSGARLWSQQRPGEALVLRQAGVLLAVGDTLVAGQGGRLAGLNPLSGTVRWEAPVAIARGVNDVERLVDLVDRVSREGQNICVRAFQAAVGCVDASRGAVLWTQKASGATGVHGDATHVFGTESDGRVVAWRRDNGQRAWLNDKLLFRGLGTPLVLGRSVVVGDAQGFVHLLSREDGTLLNRLATDGSAVAAGPVVAANTLVVVTRAGGVYGYAPQ